MTKQKILFLVPFLTVTAILFRCWALIFASEYGATWRHCAGLILYFVLLFILRSNSQKAIVGLGIFLLLATFNLLAITPAITTSWLHFGSSGITTPHVQLLSLGLFTLYFILNLDTLIDMQLDYKEARQMKARSKAIRE